MPRGRTSKKKSRRGRRGFHGRVEAPQHIRAVSPCRERETAHNPPLPVVMGVPVAEASPPPVAQPVSPPSDKWDECRKNFHSFKENVERNTRAIVNITETYSERGHPKFDMDVIVHKDINLTKKEDDYINIQAKILRERQSKDKSGGGLKRTKHYKNYKDINANRPNPTTEIAFNENDNSAKDMFRMLKEAGAKVSEGGGFMATTIDRKTLKKAIAIGERNKKAEKKLKEEEKDIKKRLKEAIETEKIKDELLKKLEKRLPIPNHPSLYKDCPCCASVRGINLPSLIKQEEEMCQECSSYDDDL